MIQDDELSAGLDVACIIFCKTLVESLVGLDQAQNLQVVLLLPNTQEQKASAQQQGIHVLHRREGLLHHAELRQKSRSCAE